MTNIIHEVAKTKLGLKEWPGAKHNPEVVAMFEASGHDWVQDDETPWCAAFVGAVLGEAGLTGTGKLNARSYLKWGDAVDISDARRGDIVVFWRGKKDGWQGHVAFFDHLTDGKIWVLGGNQGNAVSIAAYSKGRLLGIRRAKQTRTNLAQSSTMQATAATAVAGLTGAGTAVGALDGTAQLVVIGAACIAALALIWIAKERIRKWAAGDR